MAEKGWIRTPEREHRGDDRQMTNEQRARVLRIVRDDIQKAVERWKQGLTRAAALAMSDHDCDTLINLMVEHIAESEPTW